MGIGVWLWIVVMPRFHIRSSMMAMPRKHPPKNAASTIRSLAASGHAKVSVAESLRVSAATLRRWLEDDEDLNEAFDLGREDERLILHRCLVESAKLGKGANVNAMFLLKARHGYREGDQSSQQVNVALEVKPVMVVKDHGTDEEWEKRAAAQQRRLAGEAISALHAPATVPELSAPTVPLSWDDRS